MTFIKKFNICIPSLSNMKKSPVDRVPVREFCGNRTLHEQVWHIPPNPCFFVWQVICELCHYAPRCLIYPITTQITATMNAIANFVNEPLYSLVGCFMQ